MDDRVSEIRARQQQRADAQKQNGRTATSDQAYADVEYLLTRLDAHLQGGPRGDGDLISRRAALEIADARLKDVPDTVDLEADRNLFAAGYLAAAGSIKAALLRLPPSLTKSVEVQCADCFEWIDKERNHTCRQRVRRNRRTSNAK